MKADESVFQCRRLPARVDARRAAELIGVQEDHVSILVREKLLIPLGHPSPNATKYFATSELLALTSDRRWLSKATEAIYRFYRHKNRSNHSRLPELA
jgi:hypothetical protein